MAVTEVLSFNSAEMNYMMMWGNGDRSKQVGSHVDTAHKLSGAICKQSGEEDCHSEIQRVLVMLHNMSHLGDGGHKCPYFPCPDCHRTRGMFMTDDTEINQRSDTIRCEDHYFQADARQPNAQGNHFNSNVQSVPQVFRSDGDGGHRCPYFPCPDCHRTRGIVGELQI